MSVAKQSYYCNGCGNEFTQTVEQPPSAIEVVLECAVCTSAPYKILKTRVLELEAQVREMCDDTTQRRYG